MRIFLSDSSNIQLFGGYNFLPACRFVMRLPFAFLAVYWHHIREVAVTPVYGLSANPDFPG